eukprot:634156-Prymnesium_polylepis.1
MPGRTARIKYVEEIDYEDAENDHAASECAARRQVEPAAALMHIRCTALARDCVLTLTHKSWVKERC